MVKKALTASKKNPWVAGILNFFILGSGYVYNGKRKTFGWILLSGTILEFILSAVDSFRGIKGASITNNLLWISIFLIMFAFGYDAYQEAKNM